jgi:formylglycine-generating enzyme required for sulfatase activity
MKKLLPFFLVLLTTTFCFSQTKKKIYAPPGTVQINDTLFFDEAEISNIEYREMLFWVGKRYGKESDIYKSLIIDSTVWGKITGWDILTDSLKYRNGRSLNLEFCYLNHPAYSNYPVVGITYEQAVFFCKWRTERVNEWFFFSDKKNKKIKFNSDSIYVVPKVVEYFLPTEYEWEMACGNLFKNIGKPLGATSEFIYCNTLEYQTSINFYNMQYEKHLVSVDFNPNRICDTVKKLQINYYWKNIEPTVSVYNKPQNNFGLYNMIGNVAEIVAEKNISKGGSYYHNLFEADSKKNIPYSKPEAWLGFRCACKYLIKG